MFDYQLKMNWILVCKNTKNCS